ncbi:MAG: tungstate ABC transporter substrate-binding protein WtpA [Bacteroidetes bacterium]|nr:MAG: tungstate ABC transporter substrate-binding protein WtpA [Bacteroidota bacterium]
MKNILLIALFCAFLISCNNKQAETQADGLSGDLIIFHAGSLSVPFKEISSAFKKEYPGVNILLEAAGSRTCARKITDLEKDCDIMASADYSVIDQLLIPDYASWNIKFASNEMAIVYTEKSKFHEKINQDNWIDILLNEEVIYGRSDPDSDPCGYRAVLTMKLAEKHYERPGLADSLKAKNKNYIRPKETDLLGLLESGNIDYIFLYRSVAKQHGLKHLLLPDEINLKNPELISLYNTAKVEISGKKPGEKITKQGEPMVYGITIINNAPNKEAALKFVEFLLKKDYGMKIMEKNGQPSIVPTKCENYGAVPLELKEFVKEWNNAVMQ